MSASILGQLYPLVFAGVRDSKSRSEGTYENHQDLYHRLFDHFNHVISFDPDERVTVMIGPNGYGKTMILQMLDALFNQNLNNFAKDAFHRVECLLG